MVCEKTPACTKDMEREGLDLAVDGDYVYAVGTTLGGDDGIAAAMALALLDDDSIPHPRLEVVLTTEEEIGMLGAAVLDVTPLQGRELVNLDSEAEGVFTVGCAGGSSSRCVLPIHRAAFEGGLPAGTDFGSDRRTLRNGDSQGPGQCGYADGPDAAGHGAGNAGAAGVCGRRIEGQRHCHRGGGRGVCSGRSGCVSGG